MNDYLSYAAIIGLAFVIALRGWRVAMRYRKKHLSNQPVHKRRDFTRTGNQRYDDGDIPSGFGGLGGLGGYGALGPGDVRIRTLPKRKKNDPEEP